MSFLFFSCKEIMIFFFSRFFAVGVVKGSLQVDWMDARGEENMVWQNMMERPNTWVDAKLPLRASMGKVSAKK